MSETQERVAVTIPEITAETEATKLYAGKFKSVTELEDGYKNAAKVFQENESLKKQVATPEFYFLPDAVKMPESEIASLRKFAETAKLTQEQFDQLALQRSAEKITEESSVVRAKEELGERTFNVLSEYVASNYPEKLRSHMLKQLLLDKEARMSALEHRDKLLNSQMPGGNVAVSSPNPSSSKENALRIREQMNLNKANPREYERLKGEYLSELSKAGPSSTCKFYVRA